MGDDYISIALEAATKSSAKKRKVGAAIVCYDRAGNKQHAIGWNHHPKQVRCEDENGNTLPEVIHAEVHAIKNAENLMQDYASYLLPRLYVTHQPCENCLDKFFQFIRKYWTVPDNADLRQLVMIAETGMKFDTDKLRFDLIPAIATEGLAAVLTYGAKKYKPNNWRSVDPQRYVAAFERHWHAYISGEMLDKESGLPHLAHCMTNLTFLLELGYKPEQQQTLADYCKNI